MSAKYSLIAGLAGLLLTSHPGRAAPTMQVTINKAEVVTMASAPAIVLVANPQIADVVVEQGRLIFVIGKQPGETRLYVYSAEGHPLLEREVVVVPPAERAVTIVRDTMAMDYSCDPRCVPLGPATAASSAPAGGSVPPTPMPAAPSAPGAAPPAAGPSAAATVASN